MRILSHRGFWLSPQRRTPPEAFDRSFRSGFERETDIRDHDGRVVIAHMIHPAWCVDGRVDMTLHNAIDPPLPALNVKADGSRR
jgi:hypothetical protein